MDHLDGDDSHMEQINSYQTQVDFVNVFCMKQFIGWNFKDIASQGDLSRSKPRTHRSFNVTSVA